MLLLSAFLCSWTFIVNYTWHLLVEMLILIKTNAFFFNSSSLFRIPSGAMTDSYHTPSHFLQKTCSLGMCPWSIQFLLPPTVQKYNYILWDLFCSLPFEYLATTKKNSKWLSILFLVWITFTFVTQRSSDHFGSQIRQEKAGNGTTWWIILRKRDALFSQWSTPALHFIMITQILHA